MALPDLHKFKDDLKKKPEPGSNQPPIGIKADDLDKNYKKVTLIVEDDNNPSYIVEYKEDGTVLRPKREFDVCENGELVTYLFIAEKKKE
jgi:hypothetical protein